jgi:flagellar biosynthesis protein FlhB
VPVSLWRPVKVPHYGTDSFTLDARDWKPKIWPGLQQKTKHLKLIAPAKLSSVNGSRSRHMHFTHTIQQTQQMLHVKRKTQLFVMLTLCVCVWVDLQYNAFVVAILIDIIYVGWSFSCVFFLFHLHKSRVRPKKKNVFLSSSQVEGLGQRKKMCLFHLYKSRVRPKKKNVFLSSSQVEG